MPLKYCPICSSEMHPELTTWHSKCPQCLYESADLKPAINESGAHRNIDEKFRENGLRSLRIENFNQLLEYIKSSGKASGDLLDVGCAHGWFLEAAKNRGFQVLGIEPDANVFNTSAQQGLPMRLGFFPEVLSESDKFDVIVFNDVFEHIPEPNKVLKGCLAHLKPDGLLVLNLPSSTGIFYRISRLLALIGLESFFDRLWQKNLPSPHLHYFNLKNLNELLSKNGFKTVSSGRLSTLRLKGLFTRISYTGNQNIFMRIFICVLIFLAIPAILLMPSDIIYSIARKR